ncbi:cell division protein FtsZ [Desulfospira joergensenii]|uniref:cell division protein FtsZ n=1 Tax=Desulfospira joergensenii TaxID=53329 RepID=UPI0003B5F68A|nr:cell division protein FtsZ [Desulfospira joergensenii]
MSFSFVETNNSAKIKVIGVGGAGGNAVNNMIDAKLQGVKFIVANTDAQALDQSRAEVKIQLGRELTEGLGAGADPSIGRDAALESMDEIREALDGSHMVFITAGFGGGTGTGAAPVIAEICRDLGVLTVAVASKPFSFEGKKREKQALEGLNNLHDITDTVIIIPNDRLRGIAPKGARMVDMFIKADEILHHSVKGITDLIMMPGLVNLDFADVKTTMQKAGKALMGIGIASGENRATEAAEKAISHPLLEDISISGAKGVLMNITSSSDLTLDEMTEASDRIHQEVGDDAEIIWGQTFDDDLGDEMRITVIATGIGVQEPQLAENMHRFEPSAPVQACQEEIPRAQTGAYGAQAVARHPMQRPVSQGREAAAVARGQVRNPTPEELANWNEYESPVRVTQKQVVGGEDLGDSYTNMAFDNDDLEVPTFLRRKAD